MLLTEIIHRNSLPSSRTEMSSAVFESFATLLRLRTEYNNRVKAIEAKQDIKDSHYICARKEEEEDAIIRVATYHRHDLDQHVIHFDKREHSVVRRSIVEAFPQRPYWSVSKAGLFSRLPNELLQMIMLELDMEMIFTFRQVNQAARRIIANVPEYRAIATYGLDAFVALMRTGAAKSITLRQLYQPMTERDCSNCGDFGGYLLITEARRVCYKCVVGWHRDVRRPLRGIVYNQLPVVPLSTFAYSAGISMGKLRKRMTVVRSLPGWYHWIEASRQLRIEYVALSQAIEAVYEHRPVMPFVFAKEWPVRHYYQSPETCQVTVSFPFHNPRTATVYLGLSCKGCAYDMDLYKRRSRGDMTDNARKIYSRSGFLEHFKTCQRAQYVWTMSRRGTLSIDHIESRFSKNGGFNPMRVVPSRARSF